MEQPWITFAVVFHASPSGQPGRSFPSSSSSRSPFGSCETCHGNAMEWNGMEWNGMEWNGMEWNGMEWNGMTCRGSCETRHQRKTTTPARETKRRARRSVITRMPPVDGGASGPLALVRPRALAPRRPEPGRRGGGGGAGDVSEAAGRRRRARRAAGGAASRATRRDATRRRRRRDDDARCAAGRTRRTRARTQSRSGSRARC